jgi:hypothetical protein
MVVRDPEDADSQLRECWGNGVYAVAVMPIVRERQRGVIDAARHPAESSDDSDADV